MGDRVTVIIGAGLPLNLDVPKNNDYPSTCNITEQVCLPYRDYSKYNKSGTHFTNIVDAFHKHLVNNYPVIGVNNNTINFEHVFHCMEEYLSYAHSWDNCCLNTDICPVFGPFTQSSIHFDRQELSAVLPQFLLRITDIVDKYDRYFQAERSSKEQWLTDFFKDSNKWMYSISIMTISLKTSLAREITMTVL